MERARKERKGDRLESKEEKLKETKENTTQKVKTERKNKVKSQKLYQTVIYKGRQEEAASLDLHALSGEQEGGKDFSATLKPCSNNKQSENTNGPFFFSPAGNTQQSPAPTTQEASWRRDTVRCRSRGTPLVGGAGGFGDTNRQSVHRLRATW